MSPIIAVIDSFGKRACELKACYIGSSNGDIHDFYEMFVAAMTMRGILKKHCTFVHTVGEVLISEELEALGKADIILLAGGNPFEGMRIMKKHGIDALVKARYTKGSQLIGISAGGMQFTRFIVDLDNEGIISEGLNLLSNDVLVAGMHEEKEDWAPLRGSLSLAIGAAVKEDKLTPNLRHSSNSERTEYFGVGIPEGCGVWFRPQASRMCSDAGTACGESSELRPVGEGLSITLQNQQGTSAALTKLAATVRHEAFGKAGLVCLARAAPAV